MNEWTVQSSNFIVNSLLGQYIAGRNIGIMLHDDREALELAGEFLQFNYGIESEIINNKIIVKFPEFEALLSKLYSIVEEADVKRITGQLSKIMSAFAKTDNV